MAYMQSNEGTKIPKAFKAKKGKGKAPTMAQMMKAHMNNSPLPGKRPTLTFKASKFGKGK